MEKIFDKVSNFKLTKNKMVKEVGETVAKPRKIGEVVKVTGNELACLLQAKAGYDVDDKVGKEKAEKGLEAREKLAKDAAKTLATQKDEIAELVKTVQAQSKEIEELKKKIK